MHSRHEQKGRDKVSEQVPALLEHKKLTYSLLDGVGPPHTLFVSARCHGYGACPFSKLRHRPLLVGPTRRYISAYICRRILTVIGKPLPIATRKLRSGSNGGHSVLVKGAKGIKIQLAGRLGGAEMARREKQITGSIPLSTLSAKIDYGFAESWSAQGHIGVQVWINQGKYQGDISDGANAETDKAPKGAKRPNKR